MLDRKTPPPFVKGTSFDLIPPERKKLSNSIDLLFIPGGEQEVIKIEAVIKAGRWYESLPGVSQFTGNLLNKGTTDKNSFQIAQILDQYGAHLEIHPGLDFVSVALYSLTNFLKPALDVFCEILSQANFPDKELAQIKTIALQNLRVNKEKTSFLASKHFRKNIFGDHHPYGYELDEVEINAIDRTHLISCYQSTFRNMAVFVSGKISIENERLITESFEQFAVVEPPYSNRKFETRNDFHLYIEKEGSVQATIRAGKKSIKRDHPDYAYAIFVSHLLGGYFGSRLMKNIREEKGLTYGIYASLHPLQNDAYLVIGADVNKENISLTLEEIRKELKILYTEKTGHEELVTAKNHFIGSLQSEITTPFAHADKIKTLYLSKLPDNYYQTIINNIDSITPEKIIQVAEQYFHADSISEVVVG